ncbi:EAL domain-containing protein [Aliiglaciecola sp. CAU 1673]|uniref:EAL domain-containing response regulator n=1 Tax=Aliiglaciecola sp. CAU 1673 TaxID=3032595 RepID=UPI0023DC8F44|nr:EAL domain-containing response regulator [Aliiglaciecola sp. CAU 1673]MDF2177388.1 EAL domain-containing protein [Aliiglaciecola sp. CAU 1673]
MSHILIVEDVEEVGQVLCEFAQNAGYQSKFYPQFSHSEISQYQDAALIILDLNMPINDGLDVLEELSHTGLRVPIILCSGVSEDIIDSAIDVLHDSGLVFGGKLLKPFTYEQFVAAISQAKHQTPTTMKTKTKAVELTRGDLSIAIKNGWFYSVFQPQIDVKTNMLFGVECLSRLNHPLFGECYPDAFIKKLVEENLMDEFSQELLLSSLNALASIGFPKEKRISFNIDPCSLHKDLLANLETNVSALGFLPQQICFEVTELSAVTLSKEVKSLLAKLRLRGFDISLDDFGTGFSTIHELDILPFNELKIDRSFVANMSKRKGSMAIIKHTIALAQDMNMLVIGEGVETKEQARQLKEMGCQYLQGYYFSRPLDLISLQAFMNQPINRLGAG